VALPNNSTAAVVHIQKDLLVSDSAPDVQRFRRVRAPVKLKHKQRAHLSATTLEFRARADKPLSHPTGRHRMFRCAKFVASKYFVRILL